MSNKTQALIAAGHGALSELQADMQQFEWLKALMWVIKREADTAQPGSDGRIKQLADIGRYLAEDRASILGDVCRRFTEEFD